MRAAIRGTLIAVLVAVISFTAYGEWLRLTTSVAAAYSLWQTSPHRFSAEAYWGGFGLGVLYRSLSVSAAVSLADLETLEISRDPSISLGASVAFLQLGDAGLTIGVGTVVHPSSDWVSVSSGLRAFWDVLPFTTVTVGLTIQTVLVGAPGTTINIGFSISAYIPLL